MLKSNLPLQIMDQVNKPYAKKTEHNYRVLRGGPRGGGNWGTLRIPREDWGTLGKIRVITTPPSRILLHKVQIYICEGTAGYPSFFGGFRGTGLAKGATIEDSIPNLVSSSMGGLWISAICEFEFISCEASGFHHGSIAMVLHKKY